MSDLVKIARKRLDGTQSSHWEGCERDHRECLIQRMADEIERLRAENHNLKWALGTEGYEQMATPEEQAEHDKAVHAHNEFLARLEKGKSAYEAMKADAERYRFIRDTPWSGYLEWVITSHQNAAWDQAIDLARKEQP